MKKGVDFTGIVVCNLCHDGGGEYVLGFRTEKCRDEHFTWEPTGSGGLKFGEEIETAVRREVEEELGTPAKEIQFIGLHEAFRKDGDDDTHWLYIVNKVEVERSEVKITEPEKCEKLEWFKVDEFPEPLMTQFDPILEKFKNRL